MRLDELGCIISGGGGGKCDMPPRCVASIFGVVVLSLVRLEAGLVSLGNVVFDRPPPPTGFDLFVIDLLLLPLMLLLLDKFESLACDACCRHFARRFLNQTCGER